MPIDAVGSPDPLTMSVLERLGLTSASIPRAGELKRGHHVLQVEWQVICFFVTGGRSGTDIGKVGANLMLCLAHPSLANVRSMWIPLLEVGGPRGLEAGLRVTLSDLAVSGHAYRDGVTITIATLTDFAESDLDELRTLLHDATEPRPAQDDDPQAPISLEDDAEAVLDVAARLKGVRTKDGDFITTTRLVFALAESRNESAPDVLRDSVAAGAFATALRELAGDRYRTAWETYFRPGFRLESRRNNPYASARLVLPTAAEQSGPRYFSENATGVVEAACELARAAGRKLAGVEDLVAALIEFEHGRFGLALSAMGVDVETLQTEFYRRLLTSTQAGTDRTVRFALLNDLATSSDGLDHDRYARAIASFLVHPSTTGPISVSVQAPWGAGKSSLMRQIRAILDPDECKRLEEAAHAGESRIGGPLRERLTLGGVLAFLDRRGSAAEEKRGETGRDERWTVWFNAWKYESSEQVWAGLVDAIVTQISDRLDPVERELFLLRMNLARIDDGVVRRKIYDRVVTFWWGTVRLWLLLAAAAIVSMLGLAVAFQAGPAHDALLRMWPNAPNPGLLGALVTQIAASLYLVAELFRARAKIEIEPAKFSLAEYVRVPDYGKSVGVVHQIHDDLRRVLRVLPVGPGSGAGPAPLVIFIDDLDRCSPNKVATVVEGVNMFLASDLYECMFVIGMDPQMVAAALEQAHKDVRDKLPAYEKAVPLGWRFMDKFVQLPFTIPQSEADGVTSFVRTLLPEVAFGTFGAAAAGNGVPSVPAATSGDRVAARFAVASRIDMLLRAVRQRFATFRVSTGSPPEQEPGPKHEQSAALDGGGRRSSAAVKAWVQEQMSRRLTDDSSDVRQMMLAMAAEFSTNPREIKRLLNMVRFYLLLRIGRIAHGKAVPDPDQYQRWIMLSLRWPDMMRWLQWGAVQMPLDDDDAATLSTVAGRLRRLEDQAGTCADFATWRGGVTERLGLVADGLSWIDDANLLAFFKREAAIADPAKRLSAGAEIGFY